MDNVIQIGVKVDIKELQDALQQGASVVHDQTADMASQFKSLAKESQTALDDLQKAAQLAGFQISDEMTSVLEQVPKLASGIADVFSGGGIGAFIGVLLQAGIALKGLYDDVIALKGAKEEWSEINQKLAAAEEETDAKIRDGAIEHIRLTQGQAAAAHAALAMADKEVVGFGKNIDQILSGKKVDKLSDGLRKDLENLNHFTFEQLTAKIDDVSAALKRGQQNVEDKRKNMEEARDSGYYDLADSYQTSITQGEGEVKVLQQILEKLLKVKEAHDQDKDNQSVRAHQLDVQEFEQAQRKQMESLRQGLQQKKDLLDAFHTMSKEAEVKYWDDIIATGKAKGENLKEVERLRWDAQKDAQRQALQDEVAQVQDEVSAAKAGSQQRVQLLDDELRKMRQNHQDQTAEYKRLVKEREKAEQEFERKNLQDEVESVQEKIAATKAGSLERVQILEAEIQKLESENKADTEEYKRLLKEKAQADRAYQKAQEAAAEAAKKKQDEVRAIELQSAAQHEQALKSLAQSRLEFEKQIGHLSEAQYEAQLTAEVQKTYEAALKELEAKKALYKQGSAEYAKVEAEIVKLNDKYNADMEKADQKSLLRRRQQFEQYFKQLSGGFNTALNSWMQGTETASQAFSKMFQGILSQLIDFVEQWIEKKIEMWLMDTFISDQGGRDEKNAHILTDIDQIMADAYTAAANAYAANAYDPMTASLLAAQAFSTVSGFAASTTALLSGAGGIYQVPFDTVAAIHKDEQVLPASYAQGLRSMIANNSGGAGGGITVVVNHSVSAIDAESFQGAVRKHGNMIGNEVARVLRRKGFVPA